MATRNVITVLVVAYYLLSGSFFAWLFGVSCAAKREHACVFDTNNGTLETPRSLLLFCQCGKALALPAVGRTMT